MAPSVFIIIVVIFRPQNRPLNLSGELSAEVRGPSGRIPVAIDARNDGRHTVMFTPREEGKVLVRCVRLKSATGTID